MVGGTTRPTDWPPVNCERRTWQKALDHRAEQRPPLARGDLPSTPRSRHAPPLAATLRLEQLCDELVIIGHGAEARAPSAAA